MDNNKAAFLFRDAGHCKSRFAHPCEAHLGEVVKVIVVDHDDTRTVDADGCKDVRFPCGKHAVKKRN